ncbi:FAD-dependent monooxygenase [Roseateles rivi]|uniref:FAD-dependent monooxygenase n=1 Tax=Roseateles rivi TaxID=3299028 RepID=UPI003B016FC1
MTSSRTPTAAALSLAVVGAGPAGLALALLAARQLPQAHITLYDARALDKDISADPRTLALALGSVQLLQRLGCYPAAQAQPIVQVHVSQAPPTAHHPLLGPGGEPQVCISAAEQGCDMLGAVLHYGQLLAPLQTAWLASAQAAPQRLHTRFGQGVAALHPQSGGVDIELADGQRQRHDLAVVAEGGVFADQSRKALHHDYQQNAWVGTVQLAPDSPVGVAYERFTRHGPVALLPLPAQGPQRRAALVWCCSAAHDDIATLSDSQRLHLLQHQLPASLGPLQGISPLKCFPLGLNAERRLVQGRTVRIGNAAQTLHPVAGQGLNLGLRDAYTLVDALRRHPTPEAALAHTERHRTPDRWRTIATTDFLARSFTWQWPGLGATRGLALAALQALPPLKTALARQMMFGGR